MTSRTVTYKTELNQRYWQYQQARFPEWKIFGDRNQAQDLRPPVFKVSEAWRNIIIKPDANQQEKMALLSLVAESDRHKWFRSMNSSQALAQSVFGNLVIYGYLECLMELHDNEGLRLFYDSLGQPDKFEMESKINYLGEPRRTSLDCYLEGDYRVAIECKFTEPEVGTCSRPRLTRADSNYNRDYCDGTYTRQRMRLNRCSLTEIGVLYWRYIPQIFRWDSNQDFSPCPVFLSYQLIRNIISVGVTPDGTISLADGHALLIYDERNPAFQRGGKALSSFEMTRQSLLEPKMLRKCSWQQIMKHLRNHGILSWLTDELQGKYGL